MKKQLLYFLSLLFLVGCASNTEKKSDKIKVDLIVENALILTMDSSETIYKKGTVVVSNSRIIAVGKTSELSKKYKGKKKLDGKGMMLLPGFVNTHAHSGMTIFRGLSDDHNLEDWLNKYIWPAERKFVNQKTVRLGTQLAIIEMIKSGITTFSDMYFFEDAVAQECKSIGIRALLAESLIDYPTPSFKTPEQGLKITEQQLEKWKNDSLVTMAVSAHAPYSASTELIQKSYALAEKYDVPFSVHLSESEWEVAKFKKEYNKTPTEYLYSLGVLNDRTIGIHCVYLTENDLRLLKQQKVGVAHNPESNMKVACGVAPIQKMLDMGISVGIGTDGAASNNNLNMFEEMNTTAKLHKIIQKDPTVLKAQDVVKMATIYGAQALNMEQNIGSIKVGKKADFILVDLDKPHLTPLYNTYSQVVYAMQASDVETVVIDGKIIMKNRKILTINEQKVMQEMRKLAKDINFEFIK
jgi:5-methylthioadenosine/S-adenosylhomocysteine deaminase